MNSTEQSFTPHHLNVTAEDMRGNGGLGRYVFLPGSDGRASEIAEFFQDRSVRTHPRQHNVYMGTIDVDGTAVDVASVGSGMGTPSVDIIMNELFRLGVRRFLRVGTSGSLQPGFIPIGSMVVATAAVRDEKTTSCYMPPSVPAVASMNMVEAGRRACLSSGVARYFLGTVHSKASLYARELGTGPLAQENRRYMEQLAGCGVLASEMECSILFSLAAVFTQELRAQGDENEVEAGALLSIIGDNTAFGSKPQIREAVERSVKVGVATIIERERMRRGGEILHRSAEE
jgi:uridine phosphorylase